MTVQLANFTKTHIKAVIRMSDTLSIYHNPRCSKSRQTLALIEEHGVSPEIVLYLETPPSEKELSELLQQLGKSAHEIVRVKEDVYKSLGLANKNLSEQQLIETMVANPKLIERPIVTNEKQAIVGRPPENVLALLK